MEEQLQVTTIQVKKFDSFGYVEKSVENRGNYRILLGYSLVSNGVFVSKIFCYDFFPTLESHSFCTHT